MLDLTLSEQIMHFVKTLRVVREDQILRFFKDWGEANVDYELEGLLLRKWLHEQDEDRISTVQNLHAPMHSFDSCVDAVEALCLLRSKQVNWIVAMDYPVDIMFGTTDNIVYDVTTFDENWQAKASLTQMVRNRLTPEGIEDITQHVAVIRDESLIRKLLPLGFALFLIIRPDGHIDTYATD